MSQRLRRLSPTGVVEGEEREQVNRDENTERGKDDYGYNDGGVERTKWTAANRMQEQNGRW